MVGSGGNRPRFWKLRSEHAQAISNIPVRLSIMWNSYASLSNTKSWAVGQIESLIRTVSYLGVDESIDFDQNKEQVKLQAGDVLLVCSDRVYNSLNDAEIIEALQHHPDAMKATAQGNR